jgi:tetratricopeptide (TPR) repeat protein
LAAGLLAVKEAEDFLPGGSRLEADLNMADIIAAHGTPVLKDGAEQATPMTAMKCYFTFAQEQFSVAAGHEIAGSMALYALGKLHNALAQKKGVSIVAPQTKALVFYQAAMLVYPKNYMAANDLGVLLAQSGNYAQARAMLEHSLSICRQSTGWQNLAVVYRQLGQAGLSARANQQASLLHQSELARRRMSAATANDMVRWVDPQDFAQTSMNTPGSPGALPAPANAVGPSGDPARAAGQPAMAARPAPGWTSPMPAPTANRSVWGQPVYQNR